MLRWAPLFEAGRSPISNSSDDEHIGRSAKMFGGYPPTEHFGVQAGCVCMHGLNPNTGSGPTLLTQTANGRRAYLAGTARLPLVQSFALSGKRGVSFGKVTSVSPCTATTHPLLGSNTALLVGTGAACVLNRKVSFAVELESYGKISRPAKGDVLTSGNWFMV